MKTIFTTLFCLLTVSAFAQKNFVKGYYITTAGDTVQSYIDDKNWVRNPKQIRVAQSPESSTFKTLSTSEINGFGLATGDVFVREVVQIDKSPVRVNMMKVDSAPLIVTDTVFLRVLVRGKLNLLFIEDENAKEHFYIQKQEGGQPEELAIYRSLVMQNGTKMLSKIEAFRELLSRHMQGCPEATKHIASVPLKAAPLTRLFAEYNACFSSPEEFYLAPKEKVVFKVGAVAGLMPTNLKIKYSKDTKYALTPGDLSQSYTFGLSVNAVLPRANGQWSIYNEIAWKNYHANEEFEETDYFNDYRREKIDFKMGYLGLNTMLRYQLQSPTLKPFISVGVANNWNISNNNFNVSYTRSNTIEDTKNEPFLKYIRRFEQAILFGAGVEIKKVRAEIRMERGNGMSPYTTPTTPRNSVNILLGYTFN